jgi:hypothetical protein
MKIFKTHVRFNAFDTDTLFIQANSEDHAREIFFNFIVDVDLDDQPEIFTIEEIREEEIPDGQTIFGDQS